MLGKVILAELPRLLEGYIMKYCTGISNLLHTFDPQANAGDLPILGNPV